MYLNLQAEMVRTGLRKSDLARAIGKTERSVRSKIKGTLPFTLSEALTCNATS